MLMIQEQWEAYKKTEKMKWELNLSPSVGNFLCEIKMAKAEVSGSFMVCEMQYQNKNFGFNAVGRHSVLDNVTFNKLTFDNEEIDCIKQVIYKFCGLLREGEEE